MTLEGYPKENSLAKGYMIIVRENSKVLFRDLIRKVKIIYYIQTFTIARSMLCEAVLHKAMVYVSRYSFIHMYSYAK